VIEFKYFIGEWYRYPKDSKKYKIIEYNGVVFKFECGHWCTDSVFIDMVRVKTGIQVYKDIQLDLFEQYPGTNEKI